MKLLYALSLPERGIRSLSALSFGAVREATEIALPRRVRKAGLYRVTADVIFRYWIAHVGQVPGIYPRYGRQSRKFVIRYATGSTIEILSILNFWVSPVWVLAGLGDVTRAGHAWLTEMGEALKQEGLLERDARFTNMEQLLDGLARTSTQLALNLNVPPLDAAALRREWHHFQANLRRFPKSKLPTAGDVERAWRDLVDSSRKTKQPLFRMSAVAAAATGRLVGGAFLDHYSAELGKVRKGGLAPYWEQRTKPYAMAAVRNFSPSKQSLTERMLAMVLEDRRA